MLGRRHILPILGIAVVVGGITAASALLIDWLPDQAAEQAPRVDALMWFLMISCGVIFTLVVSVLLYSVWRFRAKPDDDSDGSHIHGNTRLEVAWTILPAVLLAVMAVWAIIVLNENENLDADRLEIDVQAEQFAWTFSYRDVATPVASGDLRVPVGRQVRLNMRSLDVIHDFYVPEFRVKEDVVPGIVTTLVFNPDRVGTYQVICAELCGVGHSTMRARVHVMQPGAYRRWLRQAQREVRAQEAAVQASPTPSPTPASG